MLDTSTRKEKYHYQDQQLTEEEAEEPKASNWTPQAPALSILDKTPISERLIAEWLGERKEDHEERSLYCARDGHKRVVPIRCKGRTCGECRSRDFYRLAEQYREALKGIRWPNFITIAPKNVENLTQDYLRLFHAAVKKILRRKTWKEELKGGLFFSETTNIGNGWHPHLHGLCDARWVSVEKLQREITEVMGWPVKVNVKRWDKPEAVIKYCLGYLKKCPDIYRCDGFDKKAAVGRKKYVEFAEVVRRKQVFDESHKGLRTVFAFGNLYGVPRPERKPMECPECGGCRWITDMALENMSRSVDGVEGYKPRKVRHGPNRLPVTFSRREEILKEAKGGETHV